MAGQGLSVDAITEGWARAMKRMVGVIAASALLWVAVVRHHDTPSSFHGHVMGTLAAITEHQLVPASLLLASGLM